MGTTILSRGILPERMLGWDLTTSSPSFDNDASLQYCLMSFQYSPEVFLNAFGGGLPDDNNCLATAQALLASWAVFQEILLEKPSVCPDILFSLTLSSMLLLTASSINLWTEQKSEVQSGGFLDWRSAIGFSLAFPEMF